MNSPQPVNIVGRNRSYMYEGYIRAKEEYLRVFTTEMTAHLGNLMSTFLALQLDNEAYLNHTEAPFTLTVNGEEAGRTTSNGIGWQLRPTRDLPLGEPFDAVFRLYRDGRLADLVTVPDVVLGS